MRLGPLVRAFLERAKVRVASGELAFAGSYYPDVVRYSQEAVEMSLKAALRGVGVEYPKEHDVGRVLKACRARFPDWFQREIEELAEVSEDLAGKRSPSMYGLEMAGKTAKELFNKGDAEKALSDAKRVLTQVSRLLKELELT